MQQQAAPAKHITPDTHALQQAHAPHKQAPQAKMQTKQRAHLQLQDALQTHGMPDLEVMPEQFITAAETAEQIPGQHLTEH